MPKVLIVDDEEVAAESYKTLFEMNGSACWTTGDGDDALKLITEHKPDLVLLDIRLDESRLNGLQVLEEAKKIHPTAQYIVITGFPDPETRAKAQELGAADYWAKPFPLEKLMEIAKKIGKGTQ